MRPDDRHTPRDGQGGIPDGLLVGVLAFLLGMTVLVWTATGLAALFAHGSWPSGVTFARTPLAMRGLIAQPHDISGAWPGTPPGELSGYGLFWGLFIGQLMVLVVLTVFVMSTLARWRAVRARRREERIRAAQEPPTPTQHEAPAQAQTPALVQTPAPELDPTAVQHELPTPRSHPPEPAPVPPPSATVPTTAPAPLFAQDRVGRWERVLVAPRETRRSTAAQAVRDAEGPALVVTSNPALWQETKDARAKLGPTHLY
ncbi:type VI secretion protein, partial [Streptomyces cahuitamycinicus]